MREVSSSIGLVVKNIRGGRLMLILEAFHVVAVYHLISISPFYLLCGNYHMQLAKFWHIFPPIKKERIFHLSIILCIIKEQELLALTLLFVEVIKMLFLHLHSS